MISDRVKTGPERAPHRSLWKALGYTDEELNAKLEHSYQQVLRREGTPIKEVFDRLERKYVNA